MIRTSRVIIAAAVCAGALAVGCSKSSTGPTDPFVGIWQVSASVVLNGGASAPVTPDPFTLTIAKNGSTYAETFPRLTWAPTAPVNFTDSSTASATASVTVSGDSLYVVAAEASGVPCNLYLFGTVQGNTAQGSAAVRGCSESGDGTWTATKQ